MPKSSRYTWSPPKPEPPPKPRYKSKQNPLRVFVSFHQVDGDHLVVRRGCVLVEDYFAARKWRRYAFSYGLCLAGDGWLQYINGQAVLAVEYLDTDRPYRDQLDPEQGALQLADISPALVGVDLDVAWSDPEKPDVAIIRDPSFAGEVLAAHTPSPDSVGWQPRRR